MDDYRAGLLAAGFQHVEIVDSGADLNAYAKVETRQVAARPVWKQPVPSQSLKRFVVHLHPANHRYMKS